MNMIVEISIIVLLVVVMIEVYVLARPRQVRETKGASMLVDTSVLMDGRVVELARTGFLIGQVVVPKSVLAELQLLADGSDHGKRERARMGLDVVKELQDILGASFTLLQDNTGIKTGVDDMLLVLAKSTDSAILTLDYNLNKVAQVEGVTVLNINELAKSLRMAHLPGDLLTIELTQKGQASDQAVGYLSDGTMVVVEHARVHIGKVKEIEIIRSLQTDAGKMMFAKLVAGDASGAQGSARSSKTRTGTGRRIFSSAKKSAPVKQQERREAKQTRVGAGEKTNQRSHSTRTQAQKTSAQREAELIRLVDNQ